MPPSLTHIPIHLTPSQPPSTTALHTIVAAFFPLEWPLIAPSSLTVHYHDQFANITCHVFRPPPPPSTNHASPPPREPTQVFVKLYRPSADVALFKPLMPCKLAEAIIGAAFARTGYGAHVHGVFQTADGTYGRVDEFLHARPLTPEDIDADEDGSLQSSIAEAFAAFHTLTELGEDVPLQPADALWTALARGLETYHRPERLKTIGRNVGINIDALIDYPFAPMVRAAAKALAGSGAKTGLCVHDVHYQNILVRTVTPLPATQSRAVLIDFEFALRNYRAFDLAAYFLNKAFTWTVSNPSSPPSSSAPLREYTDDEKRRFCAAYVQKWNAITGDADTTEQVLQEVRYASLLSIGWDVYNMLCVVDDEGNANGLNLEGLNGLMEKFKTQCAVLGLVGDAC